MKQNQEINEIVEPAAPWLYFSLALRLFFYELLYCKHGGGTRHRYYAEIMYNYFGDSYLHDVNMGGLMLLQVDTASPKNLTKYTYKHWTQKKDI